MYFPCDEVYYRMGNGWEKRTHTTGKVWIPISQFSGFIVFSQYMGNWWENPCISHVMKYTIGWETDGKKGPILREKYEYQFHSFPHTMGFIAFSQYMGNWWENPCISHVMKYTIGWESDGKKYPHYGKYISTNFAGFPHTMGFVALSQCYGVLMWKPMHFPYDEIR